MGILSWTLFGLVVGTTAKFVLPGRDPGGMMATAAVGIVGALFGGLLGTAKGLGSANDFEFRSMMIAAFCGMGFLFVFRLLVDRSKA